MFPGFKSKPKPSSSARQKRVKLSNRSLRSAEFVRISKAFNVAITTAGIRALLKDRACAALTDQQSRVVQQYTLP